MHELLQYFPKSTFTTLLKQDLIRSEFIFICIMFCSGTKLQTITYPKMFVICTKMYILGIVLPAEVKVKV